MGMYTQTGNVPPVGTPQSMMHQQNAQMHQGQQQPPPNSQNTQGSLPSPLYPWMRSQFGKWHQRRKINFMKYLFVCYFQLVCLYICIASNHTKIVKFYPLFRRPEKEMAKQYNSHCFLFQRLV